MKEIETVNAAGHILCHDITQIIPGKFKGARFKKGHIIRDEDIPVLISLGKEHVFVWENDGSIIHENDAARILLGLCRGDGLEHTEPSEGKIEMRAAHDGLLKIDTDGIYSLNRLGNICVSTIHPNTPVKAGDRICGMRVIPLAVKKELMDQARAVTDRPLINIIPYTKKRARIAVTGNEIKKGLIEDRFTQVLERKLAEYGVNIDEVVYTGDDDKYITDTVMSFAKAGADMIFCTGGMSVDPDDKTPLAIRNTGAEIITYGAPVLPGAMILIAYLNGIPVAGLPGCVMYAGRTIFDLILPRIIADDRISSEDIMRLGVGGFCRGCDICTFPNCGFGK